ncbi:MarR family winged helix-turn-helix transcriptional regulator [Kordiimonas aquimaris]|uniref:MarR family winged helix-turn-helix transcriptional regulator n=1 Tax=Kordiimonas aquimaris TaxID=707591 RepID=UPI0021CF35FC|nr:MarR family winged helix-turn-helix transcriptional regulator [Kordiimonas aquimaris]
MSEKTNPRMLKVWREAHRACVRSNDPDLTSRQMSILLTVYMTEPPHTVRAIAADLNVSKPVITRALDTMGRMGLIKRKKDEKDKRSILIQRTVKGAVFLSELSDQIVAADKIVPPDD